MKQNMNLKTRELIFRQRIVLFKAELMICFSQNIPTNSSIQQDEKYMENENLQNKFDKCKL